MKNKKSIPIIFFLLIILIYVTNITAIPDNIILFKNEELNLGNIAGVTINVKKDDDYSAIQTSASGKNINTSEQVTLELSLFNKVPVKTVTVNVIPTTTVIPVGNTVGLKLYTDGVLVVGMSEIEGKKPYEKTGIVGGDMIVSLDEEAITCTADLIQKVNESNGKEVNIKYVREGTAYQTEITPVKTASNEYKLGLWVRDAAAGVGTITYYEPATGNFAALGHRYIRYRYRKTNNDCKRRNSKCKYTINNKRTKGNSRRNKRYNFK